MFVGFDVKGMHDVKFADPRKTANLHAGRHLPHQRGRVGRRGAHRLHGGHPRVARHGGCRARPKSTGESQRVLSSEEVKALDKKSVELIKKIHRAMVYEFGDTPAEATKWGFDIRQTGKRSGTILMPDGRAAIIKTLAQYAKTEKTRPAAERFKAPALNDVQAVVDGLTANVNTRGTAKGQRAAGVQQSSETAARLLDLLQAAAVQIVVKQCGGKVRPM